MESPSSPLMPLGSKGHDRRRVTGKGKGTGGHITLLRPKNYTISCENLRHAPLHFPRVLALFSRGLGKRAEIPQRRRTTAAFVLQFPHAPLSSDSADLSMLHASAVSAIYDYEDGITLSFREFLFSSPKAALGSASQLDRSMLTGKKYPAFTRSL